MLTLSETTTGTFELPPAGPVAARCSRIVDLGSQESTFDGEKRMQRKLLLTWQLAELRTDGTPFLISRRFSASMNEKSSLRQFLQAWRGRPFSPEELSGFDLRKLAGAGCLLNLAHVERAGKQYTNILSVSPVPKGMAAPDLVGDPLVFDIDAPDLQATSAILESLSENLQTTITASPEWIDRIAQTQTQATVEIADDDLAF